LITVRKAYFPTFLLFCMTVMAVSFGVIRSSHFVVHAELLSLAVTLDMVILVPVVYLVLARRMGWRLLSVVPVLVLSLIAANLLIPDQHQRWLHGIELMLAPVELCLIVFLVLKVRTIRKAMRANGATADDFVEVLEQVLEESTGTERPAKIIATEVSLIYYGLVGWWKKVVDIPGRTAFTYHRSGDHRTILGVFIFLVLVEAAALHMFLLPRFAALAWVLLALSLYTVVFLLAELNAARLRPIFLDGDDLVVRAGLRWRTRIPLDSIREVETSTHDIEDKDGLLVAVLAGNQNVILHLSWPAAANGLYGMEKRFQRLSIAVDDVQAFVSALPGKRR
jgi:hypothetical protein